MIFTLKVGPGQLELVSAILKNKSKELPIYSIISLPNIKNYLIVEANNDNTLKRAIADIPYIRKNSMTIGNVSEKELDSLLNLESVMEKLKPGAIVEIKSGYLKGEKARIIRDNPTKEEVTVEILDATIKMPITIKAETVKLYQE
jgi:transcriptional antiterminator NusG